MTVDPVTGEERDASFPWMDDFDEDEYDDLDSPVDQAIVCLNVGDFDQAVYHLKEAAWAGNANAQFNLGLCYAKGCGVKRDFTKAAEWMRKAAENGDLDAVPLAETFCQTDIILKRAKAGDAAAQAELAGIYFDLSGSLYQYGPDADNREAFSWAKKAADQNDPDGLYRLGQCYQHGRGVQTDWDTAVRCFTRGANLGHIGCQRDLGVWYLEGTGVPQDEKKGFQLSLKAAVQGDNQAMFNVGMCYQLGRGVGYSLKRALDWYEASQAAYPKPELARRVQLLRAMPSLDKEESKTGLPPGHRDALSAAWKSIREKSLARAGLSSREVCLSALRNVLNSPIQRLSTVLDANLSGLVRVVQAIAEQAERKEQEAHKRKDEERRKVEEIRKKAEEEKRQPDGQGSNQETVTKAGGSASGSEDGLDRSLTVFTDGATVEAFMAKALSGQKEPEPKPQDYGGYKGFVMTVDYLDQALTAVLTVTEQKVKLEHFVRDDHKSNSEQTYSGEWTKRNGQLQIDQDVVQRDKRVLYILVFHEMRKYLRRLGLLDQLKTPGNQGAGVILTGPGGSFSAKLVKGKDRPQLPCVVSPLGEQLCRPYPDEQIRKHRDEAAEAEREAAAAREKEEARKAEEEKRKAEEARRKAEEEEKRKAEEARRKAEEEERRKAEEAHRKVEEEERRKAEEARRKAEEEEKRKAEEARKKAEEEQRKLEEERRRAEKEEEDRCRYESTVNTMERADSAAAFREAAEAFGFLSGYRDSDDLKQQCLQKATELERTAAKETEYKKAIEGMAQASSSEQYRLVADAFQSLREYRDASALEQWRCIIRCI